MRRIPILTTLVLAAIAVCAADLPAETSGNHKPADRAALKSWKVSLAPLIASQALDASSSYGMRELNPLLASSNGGFEMKAASIKLGATGVIVGVEYLIVRKYPRSARVISKLNWTSGIVTTGLAVHNFAIR